MAFCSTAAVLECARSIAAPPVSGAGGQNFSLVTTSASLDEDDEAPFGGGPPRPAATKVVATLGPASIKPAVLDALLRAGMSCARVDASNARPLFWHFEAYDALQEAVARTQRMCAVMLDTKGPYEVTVRRDTSTPRQPRGGPDDVGVRGGPPPLSIAADQTVVLSGSDDFDWSAEQPGVLPLSDSHFLKTLAPGDLVHVARYLASGMEQASLFIEVQEVTPTHAVCRALTPAVLYGLVTVTRAAPAAECAANAHAATLAEEHEEPPPPSCLCEGDREMLTAFAGRAVDFVALSHAESGAQVAQARAFLHSVGMRDVRVLAKVETRAALRDFEAILAEADGIIVSRGNLGMAVPIEKVARLQKEMILRCNKAGKLVIVTRIFDSMADAPRPTRAEATDVANAVLDGVDAFMLGAETVRGLFPVETLSCVLAVCAEAERVFHHGKFFRTLMDAEGMSAIPGPGVKGMSGREAMASTLARVADKTGARLIVIFTRSGRHAAAVAKWRPSVPVLALFPPTLVADGVRWAIGGVAACRAVLLRRGVIPMLADPRDGLSEDAMLRSALHFAEHTVGLVRSGDVVCVSHKLRDDISISVLRVGDAATSSVHSSDSLADFGSAMTRTPSASDLMRAGRARARPPRRATSNFAGMPGS